MGELLRVRVQPGAGRDEVIGWREGALRVRVTAPPHDGRANVAVTRLLAAALWGGALDGGAGARRRRAGQALPRPRALTPARCVRGWAPRRRPRCLWRAPSRRRR